MSHELSISSVVGYKVSVLNELSCNFRFYLIQPHHKGLFLLDLICEQLDIQEKDYFGLRYVDQIKQRVSKWRGSDD